MSKTYYCSKCHGALDPTEMAKSQHYYCKKCGAPFKFWEVEQVATNEKKRVKGEIWESIILFSLAIGLGLIYGFMRLVNTIAKSQVISGDINRYNGGAWLIISLISGLLMWKYCKKKGLL